MTIQVGELNVESLSNKKINNRRVGSQIVDGNQREKLLKELP